MSNRSLFILALVALAFCSYLYFKGDEPGTREKEEEAGRLFLLKADQVQRIELKNPGGTYVFQKKGEGRWEIEKPIQFSADPSAMNTLLSELEFSQKIRVIERGELANYDKALQQFGLKEPRLTARFQTPGELVELQVGGETPVGNLFYAMVRDSKKQQLVIVDDVVEAQLGQGLDVWRNPQVFDFSGQAATGLLLRRGGQEVEILKEGKEWTITKPLKEKAVKEKTDEFFSKISSLRAVSFVSESGSDPAQFGLNTPAFILEVKLGDRSQVLRVGKARPDQPGQVYAQFGDRPAVFTLEAQQAEELGRLLDEVRFRNLFKLDTQLQVDSIEITQGGSSLILQRSAGKEDEWTVRGDGLERRANALGASDMIKAMQMMEAIHFYSSVDNPTAEYGLQKPSAVVKILGNEVGNPDKLFERTVAFGASKDQLVYAQSSVLPFVVDADKRFLEALPKGLSGWFDPSLGFPAAADITGLSWTQGTVVLSVVKGEDGQWTSIPSGQNIDQEFLKNQLSYLSGLKSLRWAGKASKKDFTKPKFVLEIKVGEKSRQLLLGPKQSDGTTLAKMGDDDFAFLLTGEDVQKVMVRPVVAEPVPPATER